MCYFLVYYYTMMMIEMFFKDHTIEGDIFDDILGGYS